MKKKKGDCIAVQPLVVPGHLRFLFVRFAMGKLFLTCAYCVHSDTMQLSGVVWGVSHPGDLKTHASTVTTSSPIKCTPAWTPRRCIRLG